MNNNGVSFGGWKRDSIDSGLLEDLSALLDSPVEHLGAFNYAALGLNGTLGTRQSTNPVDVFGFKSPDGLSMHFSYLGSITSGLAFKFGFGPGTTSPPPNSTGSNSTSSTIKERANFDQQYFTWGGIDFILSENTGDGGTLSISNDYGQIDNEVSCLMSPDMAAAGHWFQVYDANHHGTIVEGAVAPFRGDNHWSAISVMQNVPVPLASVQTCEVSKGRRAVKFDA